MRVRDLRRRVLRGHERLRGSSVPPATSLGDPVQHGRRGASMPRKESCLSTVDLAGTTGSASLMTRGCFDVTSRPDDDDDWADLTDDARADLVALSCPTVYTDIITCYMSHYSDDDDDGGAVARCWRPIRRRRDGSTMLRRGRRLLPSVIADTSGQCETFLSTMWGWDQSFIDACKDECARVIPSSRQCPASSRRASAPLTVTDPTAGRALSSFLFIASHRNMRAPRTGFGVVECTPSSTIAGALRIARTVSPPRRTRARASRVYCGDGGRHDDGACSRAILTGTVARKEGGAEFRRRGATTTRCARSCATGGATRKPGEKQGAIRDMLQHALASGLTALMVGIGASDLGPRRPNAAECVGGSARVVAASDPPGWAFGRAAPP